MPVEQQPVKPAATQLPEIIEWKENHTQCIEVCTGRRQVSTLWF